MQRRECKCCYDQLDIAELVSDLSDGTPTKCDGLGKQSHAEHIESIRSSGCQDVDEKVVFICTKCGRGYCALCYYGPFAMNNKLNDLLATEPWDTETMAKQYADDLYNYFPLDPACEEWSFKRSNFLALYDFHEKCPKVQMVRTQLTAFSRAIGLMVDYANEIREKEETADEDVVNLYTQENWQHLTSTQCISFYRFLNWVLAWDEPTFLRLLMTYIRRLNVSIVCKPIDIDALLAEENDKIVVSSHKGTRHVRVFRGMFMASRSVQLFRDHRKLRYPSFFSTSLLHVVASGFIRGDVQEGSVKVLFEIDIPEGCPNATLIERASAIRSEREVIFPPHSLFDVVSVDVEEDVHTLRLRARDNLSTDGSSYTPLGAVIVQLAEEKKLEEHMKMCEKMKSETEGSYYRNEVATLMNNLAVGYAARKKHKQSLQLYKEAHALAPNDICISNNYLTALKNQQIRQENRRIELHNLHVQWENQLITTVKDAGDFADMRQYGRAMQLYQVVLNLKPTMSTAWNAKASRHMEMAHFAKDMNNEDDFRKNMNEALRGFQEAMRLNPEDQVYKHNFEVAKSIKAGKSRLALGEGAVYTVNTEENDAVIAFYGRVRELTEEIEAGKFEALSKRFAVFLEFGLTEMAHDDLNLLGTLTSSHSPEMQRLTRVLEKHRLHVNSGATGEVSQASLQHARKLLREEHASAAFCILSDLFNKDRSCKEVKALLLQAGRVILKNMQDTTRKKLDLEFQDCYYLRQKVRERALRLVQTSNSGQSKSTQQHASCGCSY